MEHNKCFQDVVNRQHKAVMPEGTETRNASPGVRGYVVYTEQAEIRIQDSESNRNLRDGAPGEKGPMQKQGPGRLRRGLQGAHGWRLEVVLNTHRRRPFRAYQTAITQGLRRRQRY